MITKLQILKHDNGGARIGVEIKDMVKNLKWVTDLNYSAGELTFDIVNDKDPIMPAMGAIVDFAWDNKDIFWGFVFSAEYTSDTTVSVKAYDFERYLKSEGSVVFQAGTLGDRYSNVCRRFGVPFNIREQPTYRVPAEVCDGKIGRAHV